jgi:hypothetical protein
MSGKGLQQNVHFKDIIPIKSSGCPFGEFGTGVGESGKGIFENNS